MDHYVTGATIRALREKYRMTQAELADQLCVSDKAISKWETGRGFPDVSLLEPLGNANMLKSLFYVCPVCGNVLFARGDALISCCGIQLPALDAEEPDEMHCMNVQRVEDEIYVSSDHSMGKDHYLSFAAYMTPDRCEIKALYPEGNAEARFFFRGTGWLYYCCNQHGLFSQKIISRL